MMTSTNYVRPYSSEYNSSESLWTNAINGLHQRYYLLADSIMWFRHQQDNSPNPLAALRESKYIEELDLLQQEVISTLTELLKDMPGQDVTMAMPIKKQLQHHTMVLQDMNHRVDATLSRLRMKSPAFDTWSKSER